MYPHAVQMLYQRTDFFLLLLLLGLHMEKKNGSCFLHLGNDKRGASVIDIYIAVPGLPLREEVETGLMIQTHSL